MTATPHNGKEADFQLFMALLDGERFDGRFRDGVHVADVSVLMRRMVKESLLKFDGTPLFPERIAYTVPYKLSDAESHLYKAVTEYVREQFNRAEALENDKRAGTVGFALTILQRRLASSPEAIYQSLLRRRESLQSRLRELELLHRAGQVAPVPAAAYPAFDAEDIEDLDEAPDNEVEAAEEEILGPRRHAGQRRAARAVVMAIERNLGFEPTDREFEKLGYDVESRVPGTGKLRFIEVKGRITGAATITVTRNEILYSLNKPDDFILAIVEFAVDDAHRVHYVRRPFQREPDFGAAYWPALSRSGKNDDNPWNLGTGAAAR